MITSPSRLCRKIFSVALALCPILSLPADNWPQWRGPQGTGVSLEKNLPTRWSATENVRWSTSLPERGNSTPIVWGDRVFITQAIEKENRRTLMCFDRSNGKLLWQNGVTYAEKELTHDTNPQCSASPATGERRVFVSFGSAGLYCYDMDGKELWHRDLGKQTHIWGNAASPIIYKELCILNFGPGERTFLIAVNKTTGKTVWQHDEPGGASGEPKPGQAKPDWIGSWTTPVVAKINGRDELIMSYPGRACAFNPDDGKELWTCAGLNPLVYTSPLISDTIVVALGGYGGSALAVRAGGSGDVTATHRLWQIPKTRQRIGSGVISGDHIYILDDPGVAECIDLKTGKAVWEERLKGPGTKGDNWSSMVLADEKLFAINQSGDSFVLKANPRFEVVSTNSLHETTIASMAVSDSEIFIRTYKNLWCISNRK
jgi:outer membrane protein assembly factor BamB